MWAQTNPLVKKLAGKLTAFAVLLLAIAGILSLSLLAPTSASALKNVENSPPDKDCKLKDINNKLEEYYDCKYKDKSGKEVTGECKFYKLGSLDQVLCVPAYGSPTGGTGNGDDNGGGGEDEETPPPEPVCDVGALSFVICPLINAMVVATEWVSDIMANLLYVQPVSLNTSDDKNVLFKAWASILTVSNIFLAIAFLFVIFAQATSMALSSYGVKKMLPKIIAAAILMNLSYYICAIAVDLSNLAGIGVSGLLLQVGADSSQNIFNGGGFTTDGFSQHIGESTFMKWVAIAGVGAILIFAFLVPALVAALAVLFTLAARLAIIVLLVMVAPLAFAAWVLPNTEKYFKKWYELFITMLMLFPLVMAMFAGTTVASGLIASSTLSPVGGNNNAPAISQDILIPIIVLLIQALPLFALPFLFKTAGGVLGRINDMAQQRIQKGADSKVGQAVRSRVGRYGRLGAYASAKGIGAGINKLTGGKAGESRAARAARAVGKAYTTARAFDKAVEQADAARKSGREAKISERAAELGNWQYDKETKQGTRAGAPIGAAVRGLGGQRYGEIVAAQVEENFGKRVKSIRSALDLELPPMETKLDAQGRVVGREGLDARLKRAIQNGNREEVAAFGQHMAIAGGATGRGALEKVLTGTSIDANNTAMVNTVQNLVYRDAYKDLVGKRGSLAKGGFSDAVGGKVTWEAKIDKVPTASLASSDAETLIAHFDKMSPAEAQAIVSNAELWSSTSSDMARQVIQAKALGKIDESTGGVKIVPIKDQNNNEIGKQVEQLADVPAAQRPTPENRVEMPDPQVIIERTRAILQRNNGGNNPGPSSGGTPPPAPTVVQQPAAPPPNFGGGATPTSGAPSGEMRVPRGTAERPEGFEQLPSGAWAPIVSQPQNPPQSPQNPPDQGNNPPAGPTPPWVPPR